MGHPTKAQKRTQAANNARRSLGNTSCSDPSIETCSDPEIEIVNVPRCRRAAFTHHTVLDVDYNRKMSDATAQIPASYTEEELRGVEVGEVEGAILKAIVGKFSSEQMWRVAGICQDELNRRC